jgi:hypothetical protein
MLKWLILYAVFLSVGQRGKNSIGAVPYQENPYMYTAGAVVSGKVLDNDSATILRIQPAYTYALYDESLVLCGDQSDRLNGKSDFMVLTYERISHRLVDGIGCHNLVGVNEIKTKRLGEN